MAPPGLSLRGRVGLYKRKTLSLRGMVGLYKQKTLSVNLEFMCNKNGFVAGSIFLSGWEEMERMGECVLERIMTEAS